MGFSVRRAGDEEEGSAGEAGLDENMTMWLEEAELESDSAGKSEM